MKAEPESKKRFPVSVALLVAAGVVVVLLIGSMIGGSPEGDTSQAVPTFSVREGPLDITITETGTIRARDQVVIKSEVEGRTTILSLVPEGKYVEKGELLIELDASTMEDEVLQDLIDVQNAEAGFVQARENLEVTRNQVESDVARAELDLELAKTDLAKYTEGDYPNLLREAQVKITLARETMERATETAKWSDQLYKEKYISQSEVEADRLAMKKAELDYELAVAALKLLEKFTYKRELAELESNVEQTRMALERTRRRAVSDVVQAEAELKARELELKQERNRLEEEQEQLTKTKIYAPVGGMVVYATSARGGWRGNDEPLDEGREVREREELIYLPTADAMIAEVKVHESNLEKLSLDLPVTVTVDALPGRVFSGRITRIAPLPDPTSVWLNPDLKVYDTEITLDSATTGLRTGMTCKTEILVERYARAKYVPVQCVVRQERETVVFMPSKDGLVARPIEIGLDNNSFVHVIDGLEAGDLVALAPPLNNQNQSREEESPAEPPVADQASKRAELAAGDKGT